MTRKENELITRKILSLSTICISFFIIYIARGLPFAFVTAGVVALMIYCAEKGRER